MISEKTLYFGVDPASVEKDFSYAVLDNNLNLIELADADISELITLLDEGDSAFVAVNAPLQVNLGLVKQKLEEESPNLSHSLRGVDIRLAEYELREHGITVTGTPSHEEYCPAWMRAGFALYQELSNIGFTFYGKEDAKRQVLETQPYACFCALLGGTPLSKPTLEGRLQRQLLLNDKGLRINDAMEFFEEITRFKLMKGILPTDVLYSPEKLDVLVAAYLAWLVGNQPDEVIRIGDQKEGQVVLPAKELENKYE